MENNPILKYLGDIAELTKKVANGSMFKNMYNDAREIKISLLQDVFTPDTIETIRRQVQPKAKECYKNATLFASLFPDVVRYVEGYMTVNGNFPVEHAFNLVHGKYYVDITKELVLGDDPREEFYVTIGDWSYNEVEDILFKTQVYGGIYQYKVIQNIKKQPKKQIKTYGKDLSNKR